MVVYIDYEYININQPNLFMFIYIKRNKKGKSIIKWNIISFKTLFNLGLISLFKKSAKKVKKLTSKTLIKIRAKTTG